MSYRQLLEPEAVTEASQAAIARATRRDRDEVAPDDLLLGALELISRVGVAVIGPWALDLDALDDEPEAPARSDVGPAYSSEAVAVFDRAAALARRDRAAKITLLHLLAAFGRHEGGLMGRLKQAHGITDAAWRAELARIAVLIDSDVGALASAAARAAGGERELLTPDDAAELLGVHTQTVRGYIKGGKLPAFRLAGERSIRIRRRDLDTLLEALDGGGLVPGHR